MDLPLLKISTGNYDIIASNRILSFENNPIEITVLEGLKIVFKHLIKDNSEPSVEVDSTTQTDTVIINFTNGHKAGIGYGFQTPFKAGKIDDRDLYISARIDCFGDGRSFGIAYTLFLQKRS
jgi:hypothetical protein